MLEKLGCEVDTAENGAEAIDRHASGAYAMVLMDRRMPVLDGYQAAARLPERERASGRHTPIIAMTANDETRDRDRCLAAGMDGFLAKPILTDDLRSTVERWPSAPRRAPSTPRSS
jgi:CheY-like chemotaxis protein